ncbi:MAG TPA: hypothetical protein VFU74_04570 [Actinocrinis sp.]|nr:hypothetical protein [Actinocrinis sp.]
MELGELAHTSASVVADPLRPVEFDRIVPASGNMTAAGRQIWMGPDLAGQQVTVWVSTTTLHVFHRRRHRPAQFQPLL